MKVHSHLCVIVVDEPITRVELEHLTSLNEQVITRLSDTELLVNPRHLETLLQQLVAGGFAPTVVS